MMPLCVDKLVIMASGHTKPTSTDCLPFVVQLIHIPTLLVVNPTGNRQCKELPQHLHQCIVKLLSQPLKE